MNLEKVKNQIRGGYISKTIPYRIYERAINYSKHIEADEPVEKFGYTRHCFEYGNEVLSLKRKGGYCELFGRIDLVDELISLWEEEYKV